MTARKPVFVLFGFWVVAFAASFLMFLIVEPNGSGWERGLNRLTAFIEWQLGALVLALIIWASGRNFKTKSLGRWLCRVPIMAALLLVLIVGGVVVASFLQKPARNPGPQSDPKPVTVPIIPASLSVGEPTEQFTPEILDEISSLK